MPGASERRLLCGLEYDLPEVHHGGAGLGLGLYRERVPPGLLDLERADFAGLEVLEAAGVLHRERELLLLSAKLHFRAAAAFPAALQNFHGERAAFLHGEVERGVIVLVRPEAERVLVRQRLEAELHA